MIFLVRKKEIQQFYVQFLNIKIKTFLFKCVTFSSQLQLFIELVNVLFFQFKTELSQQFEQLQNIRQSSIQTDEDGNDVIDLVKS